MRDIVRRIGAYPLAGAERDIFREARAEVALSLMIDTEQAEQMLTDTVHLSQASTPAVSEAAA